MTRAHTCCSSSSQSIRIRAWQGGYQEAEELQAAFPANGEETTFLHYVVASDMTDLRFEHNDYDGAQRAYDLAVKNIPDSALPTSGGFRRSGPFEIHSNSRTMSRVSRAGDTQCYRALADVRLVAAKKLPCYVAIPAM